MKTIAPPIPNAVIGQAIRHGTDNRACSLRWLRVTAGVGVAPDRCPWGMDSLHPNVRVIPHMTPTEALFHEDQVRLAGSVSESSAISRRIHRKRLRLKRYPLGAVYIDNIRHQLAHFGRPLQESCLLVRSRWLELHE